jgi:hypothetical protein
LLASGVLNDKGQTTSIYTDKPESIKVYVGNGAWVKQADSTHA